MEKEIQLFDCLSDISTTSVNHGTVCSAVKGGKIPIFNCLRGIPIESTYHGTICSAIAVGSRPLSFRGVAPGATLIVYRTAEGMTCYNEAILKALQDIKDKVKAGVMQVDVVSISSDYDENEMEEMENKIEELTKMGITFVAAVGNRGNYQARASIPARFPSVISVGAVDKNGIRAAYTAKGRTDVYAPGDVELPSGEDLGTSYATPAIGGLVLLLKQWANSVGSPAKDYIHCPKILRKIFSKDMLVKPDSGGEPIFDPVEFFVNMKDNPKRLNMIVEAYLEEEKVVYMDE